MVHNFTKCHDMSLKFAECRKKSKQLNKFHFEKEQWSNKTIPRTALPSLAVNNWIPWNSLVLKLIWLKLKVKMWIAHPMSNIFRRPCKVWLVVFNGVFKCNLIIGCIVQEWLLDGLFIVYASNISTIPLLLKFFPCKNFNGFAIKWLYNRWSKNCFT